jgi:hypothetical protein
VTERRSAYRAQVETRFGAPTAPFEGGRIVSSVYYDVAQRRLGLVPEYFELRDFKVNDCFGLMIEYSAQGQVARYALVRHGSARCLKEQAP